MFKLVGCITQQHDLRLVLVAAVICGIGSFATVILMARAQVVTARMALTWLIAAAAVFGCSVWSLHFIAMLAFMAKMPIAYDVAMTVTSVAIAVGGSFLAMLIWRLMPTRRAGALIGGVTLGLAVSGMHYTGVAAMRLPGVLSFDHVGVAVSIVFSIVFAVVGLARTASAATAFRQVEASVWLGLSVFGLHFIGMASLRITPGPSPLSGDAVLGSGSLAVAVASISLAIVAVSLAATLIEQHLAERSMQEFRRMRLLSDLAHEVMMIHRDGIVIEVNSAGTRLFGMPAEAIIGRPIESLFTDDSVPILLRRTRGASEGLWPDEMAVKTAAGDHVQVEFSSQSIDFKGKPAIAVALRDLSERKRDEARIHHLAHYDLLTDLPGRFLLQERLARALDAAAQAGHLVAVLYLDLDRFKPINDVLGHAGGDAVLVQVAERLTEELRATDTLARVGGDEFVILLPDAQAPSKVSSLARRLIESLDRSFEFEGRQVGVGVSIGIAMYPEDGNRPETILRAADTAMYRAKAAGRGAVRFFEASMDAHLHDRRQLEQELRHATQRGEMELVYQPLVNGGSGEIDGFEALIRWRHPQRGMVSPADFIPIAEESGDISRIGRWTIDTACAAAVSWTQPWHVAVNVSPSQFRTSDVPAIVAAALARTGLDPARLEIEITEGVFIDDATKAVSVLSSLRALGVRLSLDDFGTGYSSLSYLRLFTFDKIKVDQSFVPELGQSDDANMIVNAIIALGHNLGLSITVEGVETEGQLALLRAQGADQMQGFLFARPAAMETFSEGTIARMKERLFTPLLPVASGF